jgi:mono/diheme cytochrome c family protein
MTLRRLLLLALLVVSAAGLLSACGSESVNVPNATASVQNGAKLFSERCSGCHTMDVAGAQGSATKVSDRERVDGPNLNKRKVCYENALYALRNGGYSGAIMPANIVVGTQARDVAAFIAEYSGRSASNPASPSGPAVKCPALPAGAGG